MATLSRLDTWVTENEWKGYDPFDGLNSAWARPLTFDSPLLRTVLQQMNLRSPFNLRTLLAVRPNVSSKAMGYFARGYLKLHQVTGEQIWLDKATYCLDWLESHPCPNQPGLSWGNHFDYQSRAFYLPKNTPTVVWTALIGHAFLDAFEIVQARYLDTAKSVASFILNGPERRPEGKGICISYIPGEYHAIHNANMLAAGFLSRVYSFTREDDVRQVAADAVAYTGGAQLPDGSWWYGEEPKYHWVDNWHTAYVLDSLRGYMQATGDMTFADRFQAGVRFWLDHFFLENGTPRYYAGRTYPIDIQCASQAIESLCLYARAYHPSCLDLARKVAWWTIANMQDKDGHFYFRRTSVWVNKTPTLHWGQATMLHALSCLLQTEQRFEGHHDPQEGHAPEKLSQRSNRETNWGEAEARNTRRPKQSGPRVDAFS